MKQILLLVSALFAFSAARAQYYIVPHLNAHSNPGKVNTENDNLINSTATGWTILHTGPAATPVWSSVVNFPANFNFRFNNVPVSSYKVSTSGVLTFNTTATTVPDLPNTALPGTDIPDRSIAVWGLKSGSANRIIYKIFGAAPNRQYWVQFNNYSANGNTVNGGKYWSIVMEEATHKIYVVDQRVSSGVVALTVGLQINAASAIQVAASPNVGSIATNLMPTDNGYYEFIPGAQPNYDLEILKIDMLPQLALAKAPYQIKGTIKNNGAIPVTSFEVQYQVDANPIVSATISGVNIMPYENYTFTHPITWNPGALGSYSIETQTMGINGSNQDQETMNNYDFRLVDVVEAPRMVLHEVFTSSTCPPCKPGNENLREITTNNPGISIDIKYQQTYPANPLGTGPDPYSTLEARNRHTNFYGINSIPRMEVNGGWNQNAGSYTDGLLTTFQATPANVLVDGTYEINGTTVTANAVIMPFVNVPSNNLVAHMVITERHTVNNARSNGETDFYNVMKKMMPNENGQPIAALVANQPVSLSQTYTFPAGNTVEHFDSLEVVFFVQDKITKEVFNAGNATRIGQTTGIAANQNKAAFNLYPNPATSKVTVTFMQAKTEKTSLHVYNTLGKEILVQEVKNPSGTQQLELDLSGEASGVYLVRLQAGTDVVTKKISLVK